MRLPTPASPPLPTPLQYCYPLVTQVQSLQRPTSSSTPTPCLRLLCLLHALYYSSGIPILLPKVAFNRYLLKLDLLYGFFSKYHNHRKLVNSTI